MIKVFIDDEEHDFPSKKEVCHDCEGNGHVLNPSMRNHAYSYDDFQEEFDEEGQSQYFKVAGIYDIPCPTCKGKNVIDVIDEDQVDPELFALYADQQIEEEEFEQIEAWERKMGA